MTSRAGIGGRLPGPIDYEFVSYNDKEYCIGTLLFNNKDIQFIFDKDDYEKIYSRAWHFASAGGYISSAYTHESKRKEMYLHNLIMNRFEFPGKGATETVDHINRNGLDNRKENLRIISQSEQNINQDKKSRNIKLPDNCEIIPNDIPKHIWYIKANGLHGDRFGIDLKTENIKWKTSSSKKILLKDKLIEAKNKLQELYLQYPYLNPNNEESSKKQEDLRKSFEEIIALSD
jgi:hypothetical protein